MPIRATKRGLARTRLDRDCDVLICGASFAGLAVARELRSSDAKVLVIDRYQLGERQTSACAMPTVWLDGLELQGSLRQTFDELRLHTPLTDTRWTLPWSFSTFDYRELCALLWEQTGLSEDAYETAKVDGLAHTEGVLEGGEGLRTAPERGALHTVRTDRGEIRAPLVIDCLGWRRVLASGASIQPPQAPLTRGLEVHPAGRGQEMELWIDPSYARSGYGWSFPAGDELRVGVCSFRPSEHVKEPTVRLAGQLGLDAVRYQGNWIPHRLRPAVADGLFFVGDSAGHCLPLTAEGIRTALYFGLACGRELRAVLAGDQSREQALHRYGAFSDAHERAYRWLLRIQRAVCAPTSWSTTPMWSKILTARRYSAWLFNRYLAIAPPSFIAEGPPGQPWTAPGAGSTRAAASANALEQLRG
jgi:flavin-dependent dehydrogenase